MTQSRGDAKIAIFAGRPYRIPSRTHISRRLVNNHELYFHFILSFLFLAAELNGNRQTLLSGGENNAVGSPMSTGDFQGNVQLNQPHGNYDPGKGVIIDNMIQRGKGGV